VKTPFNTGRALFLLIILSTIVRGIIAAWIELGNDEVYYYTYALYPDWSHFDHPPMVGWIIQLFTLDLLLQDEFFIRLAAVVIGAINTYLIFLIGKQIKDEITGWYAALLYTASIYAFIITGIFILPDTPQTLFWLLAIYLAISIFTSTRATESRMKQRLILLGLVLGFGLLSKYTTLFIWIGILLYIIIYDRKWLTKAWLYFSAVVTFIIFLPVVYWNIQHDFISFTFQGERVGIFSSGIQFQYFLREFFGQMLYNNPVNFVLILVAIVALIRKNRWMDIQKQRLLLFTSIPIISLFLFFSFFRSTLPHWTAPAYLNLIVVAASYLSFRHENNKQLIPNFIKVSLSFTLIILMLGISQIQFGVLYNGSEGEKTELGKKDLSLDLYGWKKIGDAFSEIYQNDVTAGSMDEGVPIICWRWFPAAHLDYYVATPNGLEVKAIGSLERIHKYAWINELRGGFQLGMDGYFVTTSHDFTDPTQLYSSYFHTIEHAATIPIKRSGKIVEYAFVYRMCDLVQLPGSKIYNP